VKVSIVIPQDRPGSNNFHQVPIGALYSASQLRQAGVDVDVYDLRSGVCQDPTAAYRQITGSDLAVVISSEYDLAQCYPSLSPTTSCIRNIRDHGTVPVAVAGSHATADAELTLDFTGADCAVRGEFEFALPSLAGRVDLALGLPRQWPEGELATATPAELAALPMPAYELAPMHRYASEGLIDGQLRRVRSGLLLGNRGCPFACNFCYLLFGRRLRRRPVGATLDEMETMRREHDIEHFFFLDYTFTLDNGWVKALCTGILERKLQCSWICQTRVDCLDEETLRLMARAGCSGVWLGIESPNLEQRRYLSKGRIGFEAIEDAIELIRRCGMTVLTFVIVGVPQESSESLRTLNSWFEASQVFYSLSVFQRRLGTPLAAETQPAVASKLSWAYLDEQSGFLGESSLRLADLDWFFAYHHSSPRRVANAMRSQMEAA
jgi:anaerobic magnesium-protoporphyrin IX monomethyl ester cyclase